MSTRPWIGVALLAACVSAAACGGGGDDTTGAGASSGPGGTGGSGATGGSGGTGGAQIACGNGERETGEACDGDDFGGESCKSHGFGSGALSCKVDCTLDTSMCSPCGNDVIDGAEDCDGLDLAGQTCVSKGFGSGELACAADCKLDTSACNACGNGQIDGVEACDGANLNGSDCVSEGFGGGTLKCGAACELDTALCDPCGNGVIDDPEACDGLALNGATCEGLGFQTGMIVCNADCTFDTSACTDEICSNGADDTNDGLADCADPLCAAQCADACLKPAVLVDPSIVNGDTTGHANVLHDNCYTGAASGPEVVYTITAAQTGVLDLMLTSAADLSLSARAACADDATDIGCKDESSPPSTTEHLLVPITVGQMVLVMVEGYDAAEFGPYTLDAKTRPIMCGDGYLDPGELCDDGNVNDNDGCSSACVPEECVNAPVVNVFTTINGDTTAKPDYVSASCAGSSGPEDVYSFTAPSDGTVELSVTTTNNVDLGVSLRSACNDVASELGCSDVITNGTELLSVSVVKNVTYALVIDGYDDASPGPYTLKTEFFSEIEPNDTTAQANAFSAPWWGRIGAAGDFDFVKVTAAAGQIISAQVTDVGDGACAALTLDSDLTILASDGTTQVAFNDDIDVNTNYCSSASYAAPANGTYYVVVRASQQFSAGATFNYKLLVTVQ